MKRLCLALAAVALCASTAFAETVTVVAPNGGEQMCLGQTFQIRWTVTDFAGNVRLVLFKAGVKVERIADVPAAAGIYPWNVGQTIAGISPAGPDYTIKAMTTSAADFSNGNFTIKNAGECGPGPGTPTPTPTPGGTIDPSILAKIRAMRFIPVKIPGPGPGPCLSCPSFDLGELLDLVSNPTWGSQTLTLRLLKNGQPIANLGMLGKGQALPRSVSTRLSAADFALFKSNRGAFQIGVFGANGMLQHQIGLQ
jgi:hypothetical protein